MCVVAQPGDDDWRNEDAVDWPHQRRACSSSSSTEEIYDGGKNAPSTRVCNSPAPARRVYEGRHG